MGQKWLKMAGSCWVLLGPSGSAGSWWVLLGPGGSLLGTTLSNYRDSTPDVRAPHRMDDQGTALVAHLVDRNQGWDLVHFCLSNLVSLAIHRYLWLNIP